MLLQQLRLTHKGQLLQLADRCWVGDDDDQTLELAG